MHNINEYNDKFEEEFVTTDLFNRLQTSLPNTKFVWNKQYSYADADYSPRDVSKDFDVVSLPIFYYLNFLFDSNPDVIYDLGCGQNFFKRFVSDKIIGIDPCNDTMIPQCEDYVDQVDMVTEQFVAKHQEFFDSVFSINALHFIELTEFKERVDQFVSMMALGARGVLVLNAARFTNKENLPTEDYIRGQLDKVSNVTFLVVDIDFTEFDEPSDGNIRLVFERSKI